MSLRALPIAAALAGLSLLLLAFLAAGVAAAAWLAAAALVAAGLWGVVALARRRISRARDNTA